MYFLLIFMFKIIQNFKLEIQGDSIFAIDSFHF